MRKRYRLHRQGHEHLDRWLVSYADYMTLIFALFVVLYSAALINKERYLVVIDGLSHAFTIETQSRDSIKNDQVNEFAAEPTASSLMIPSLPENLVAVSPASKGVSLLPSNKNGMKLALINDELSESMGLFIDSGSVKLVQNEDWLTIEISAELLFSSGSAFMTPNSASVMNAVSKIIKPINNYVRVRGYTDNLQINNELFSSNWVLSAARAQAVLDVLVASGIAPQRLAYEAYGEFSPFTDNDTEEGRLQNRKVVIAVSRLAWEAPPPKSIKSVVVDSAPNEVGPVTSTEIKEITLPGGGIRITTRQD
ncbi:OmpA family protein [Aeromonas cavernicola]|uniref:Cell envelope biogenesis protein OmpA n=1 Tax=Aeromonas cavernicola TaxID=1006623 RepID=A0A2H9U9D5_9GAMM|nr:OmpA family protein [Aeromonas cavernicola]PJG60627.1 cell envelope biogenesis protein OmpA [Aeromonas cavernicola]